MKKIFTLLALLISLVFTSEIIASNNQVVAKSTGCTSIDGKYQYSLLSGTYIIAVIIDGNINAQKVIVK